MTRNRHDLFAKQHLEALLEAAGDVTSSRKVISETREVDIWFVPRPEDRANLEDLGLLGQIAQSACVIEPFRNSIQSQDILGCLGKLIDLSDVFRRQAKREGRKLPEDALPRLWILSPTISRRVLEGAGAKPHSGWPGGIYFLAQDFRAALVAIHQLPVNEETLWLRLMGRGLVQSQAITELLALPEGHPTRWKMVENLGVLQIGGEMEDDLSEDERRELVRNLTPVYEEWRRKTLEEGRREGRQEGKQDQSVSLVLRLLLRQIGGLSPEAEAQVRGLTLLQLEMLGEALLDFSQPSDLENWLRSL
jgi:Domain of unknown function (DUF4351)